MTLNEILQVINRDYTQDGVVRSYKAMEEFFQEREIAEDQEQQKP